MLIELQKAKKVHNLQAIKTRVIHTLAVVSVNSCSFRETNKKDKENESRFVKKNLFAGIVCCSEILHRSGKFYGHDRMIRMTSHHRDDIHRKYSCINLSSRINRRSSTFLPNVMVIPNQLDEITFIRIFFVRWLALFRTCIITCSLYNVHCTLSFCSISLKVCEFFYRRR